MRTKNFSIHWYRQDIKVIKAKKLTYPYLRGTLLPSIDFQCNPHKKNNFDFEYNGIALNWLWVRIRICFPNLRNFAC